MCVAVLCLSASGGCSKHALPTGPLADLLAEYRFVQAWGDSGSGDGQLFRPKGVAVDASGDVYVMDSGNSRIQKFSNDGQYLTQWGSFGTGDGQFRWVQNLAVDANGNVYVADEGNERIQKFTRDGVFVTKWGSKGTGDTQFGEYGMTVAVGPGGDVYVLDTIHDRIQKFTGDGVFVTKWGSSGTGDGQFIYAMGLAVDGHDHVYAMDGGQGIHTFANDGTFLERWDIRSARYWSTEFLAGDQNQNVFVSDRSCSSIRNFTSGGWSAGRWAPAIGWNWTPHMAVDRRGNVYVVDTEAARVLKYAPVNH